MKVVVATHGHCFDGLCSAVLFTRLARQVLGGDAQFQYRACGYGVGQRTATEADLLGDVNAILDYRFAPSPRLDWYFDHHRTAFASPADRAIFDARAERDNRYHFQPEYSSCTKLIHDIGRRDFALEGNFDDLVAWADRVDSAAFDSADAAISRSDPIMQFVSVVEHHGGDAFIAQAVAQLVSRPLHEVAASAEIKRRYAPLGKRHERFIAQVRAKAQRRGRVVFVDLTDKPLPSIGKFVTYALYPESTYSVVVARLNRGFKISVGYNPWCGKSLDTDISSICARYGGGGHSVVGGISVADGERDRAWTIADHIATELDR